MSMRRRKEGRRKNMLKDPTVGFNRNSKRRNKITKSAATVATTTSTAVIQQRGGKETTTTTQQHQHPLLLLERKIDEVTADLKKEFVNRLAELPDENALIICNYLLAMKIEINLSKPYKQMIILTLCYLSRYHNHKLSYKEMGRDHVTMYLNSMIRPESMDRQHKWVGTYNMRLVQFQRFFKWLYSPDVPQKQRPTPEVVQNIPRLRRKEITTIKPSDLWTEEDDALFLKYCTKKRDRAYHMIARDSSCRPSEILGLRMKDLAFMRTVDNKQYVQITVNGKTGTRNIPLFNAVPYIKDWIDDHPMKQNPNAYLIPCLELGHHITKGEHMSSNAINIIYNRRYKKELFTERLLTSPLVPPEDKIAIKELLKKPWNPYIRRHSALTQKAQKLTAPVLKQHAGWSPGSKMETKYLHFLGAESNDAILSEIYGLETAATLKSKKLSQAIAPKICPQCNESNISDSKFCAKCRMVLTYDAYQETIEEQKSKDSKLQELEQRMQQQQKLQEVQQKILESITKSLKITGKGGDMDRETTDKTSVLYTDERYKKLNMTQEQYQLATERIRQENEEAIHNTLLPEIANIAKGLQDNDIAAAKAAAKRILESKDFNEKAFLV